MAFHFSLGSVLRVRGILEEQEERMLQKIQAEITQTVEAIRCLDAQIAGSNASRRNEVAKRSLGRNLHASYQEVKDLKQLKTELEDRAGKLEQLRLRQLLVYDAARRDREMLTKMQETKRSAYESDMARTAQKTIDDNFNARRGRC
jgi:flagellar biosynthesis chaperone FliJ